MPDATTRHTTRPWMREDANNMPRQKLMRMTLDALRDLANGQDQLAVDTQREINKLWGKMEDWHENKAVVDNRQYEELRARVIRLTELVDSALTALTKATTQQPVESTPQLDEQPAPQPEQLTNTTPYWELSNSSRNGAPVGSIDSKYHPNQPSHPEHAHWLKVLAARSLAFRVYNLAQAMRTSRITHSGFAKILKGTQAWRQAGNPHLSQGVMYALMHAALIWEFREIDGELASWGHIVLRNPKLQLITEALIEILELNAGGNK